MDLASHAPGEATNATYDKTDESYVLRLIRGKAVKKDEEITITYGDEKGACEMIFSYGFLDDAMDTAETLFLSLSIAPEDSYRVAKAQTANCAPGFKIIDIASENGKADESTPAASSANAGSPPIQRDVFEDPGEENLDSAPVSSGNTSGLAASPEGVDVEVDWKGDFVWLLCINPDDGLTFEVVKTVDGQEEVGAKFQGQEFQGAAELRQLLAHNELWDVYRLRAIVILQQRVFEQLQVLFETQERVELTAHGDAKPVRSRPHELAVRLRRLEFELLEKAYGAFEAQVSSATGHLAALNRMTLTDSFYAQKLELADSAVVRRYLAEMNRPASPENEAA